MRNIKKLVFVLFAFVASLSFAQQLPNPDFENWSGSNSLDEWNILNFMSLYYSGEQTTNAAFGNYAVKLESQSVFGMGTIPGIFLLGELNLETMMPEGGIEFPYRPTGISFFMKYEPMPNDSMLMLGILTKWNSTLSKTDTIGVTGYFSSAETPEYTKVTMPFIYFSEQTPDSVNVGFSASGMEAVAGSTLYIDSVTMEYGMLILPTICVPATNVTTSGFTAAWMPLPNATGYYLDVSTDENFSTFVSGYENLFIENTSFEPTYELTGLNTDLYYIRIRVAYGDEISENSNVVKIALPTETTAGTSLTSNSFTANWVQVPSSENYEIDVATDANFEQILPNYNNILLTTNSLPISNLSANTDYFYRVRVNYDNGKSGNSNTTQIKTSVASKIVPASKKDLFEVYTEGGSIIVENVSNPERQNIKILVYDYTGNLLTEKNTNFPKTKVKINKTGVYVVNIITEKNVFSNKIVIIF